MASAAQASAAGAAGAALVIGAVLSIEQVSISHARAALGPVFTEFFGLDGVLPW